MVEVTNGANNAHVLRRMVQRRDDIRLKTIRSFEGAMLDIHRVTRRTGHGGDCADITAGPNVVYI